MSTPPPAGDPTATTSGSPETPAAAARGREEALLDWGRRTLRDLPWRRLRDPWAILVSEVMAQQTQVSRVVPKWEEFIGRWPTVTACADARLGEILGVWSGLGYPRRARDLHATAQVIVERHGGEIPDRLDELLALPGVGPYTARAVLAFAFEHDVGVVDTNIARVLARWQGRPLGVGEARRLADEQVPAGAGWWWNQSAMELGARRCRPRDPDCDGCPVARWCAWQLAGRPSPDPASTTALVSGRQKIYAGSDREARGRVLAAVTARPLSRAQAIAASGIDDTARAARVVHSLVLDRLVVEDPSGTLSLP